MRTILSFDGGGAYSITPLQVLAKGEEIGIDWGLSADLIVGTSAGSILGSWIATGQDCFSLSQVYKEHLQDIFSRNVWHTARTLNGVIGPKYSSDNLLEKTKQFFNVPFSDKKLNKLMILSCDFSTYRPKFFKNWREEDQFFRLFDAVMASSSAPSYFKPYKTQQMSSLYTAKSQLLVDGGIVANNPAMCAYVEARKLWPKEDLRLISFGTGKIIHHSYDIHPRNWGLLQWARRVPGMLIGGGSSAVDHQMNVLSSVDNKLNYLRIDANIHPDKSSGMDDVSDENLDFLSGVGSDLASQKIHQIQRFLEM